MESRPPTSEFDAGDFAGQVTAKRSVHEYALRLIRPALVGSIFHLLAGYAKTGVVHRIIDDLEVGPRLFRDRKLIEPRILEIDHGIATYANQMVMMAGIGVKARCRSQVMGAPDRSHLHERLKRPIDRRAGDFGHARPYIFMHLIGGWMILPLQHAFENNTPLHGKRKSALAAHLFKGAQLVGEFWRT